MENASKALIIAGAILVSILIISLGIMILNQAQSAIDGSGMSDAEVTAFNQKFTKYEGTQKGSMVRSLVQEVIANNSGDSGYLVGITGVVSLSSDEGAQDFNQPNYGSLKNTAKYKVEITAYDKGRVSNISVTAVQ